MPDLLETQDLTGIIRTSRHASVRYRAGNECGEVFDVDEDFDGFTLTIEVRDAADALAMLEAIRNA